MKVGKILHSWKNVNCEPLHEASRTDESNMLHVSVMHEHIRGGLITIEYLDQIPPAYESSDSD